MSRLKGSLLAAGTLVAVLAAALVVTAGHLYRAAPVPPVGSSQTPLYWYDPMRPTEHFDKPGKSPFMDMQLIPKYPDRESAASQPSGSIAIDPRMIQDLGIRLAPVERSRFARVIDTVGIVAVDEHRLEAIQVRESGWVERLDVRAVGDAVHRGQLLAGVYSPDLLSAQQELLIAQSAQDPDLIDAARHRLERFGLAPTQIERIEKTGQAERRVDYFSPFDGYVTELGARQGAAVAPGTTLFQLASLQSVWILAEVTEAEAADIKVGDPAEAELSALPGARFRGRIDYLYPELSPSTRTLKVRVVIPNSGERLRPGMYAAVQLQGPTDESVLTVPTEAVIKTGTRSIVLVATDASHFRPASVSVGAERGGRSEILEGLAAGARVVASGEFLIDSEANLRSAVDHLTGSSIPSADEAH